MTNNKFSLFIAKRIAFGKSGSFSAFIIKIAIAAVALSVGVMVIATSVVNGFQNEISRKVFGFWGHIHVTAFDLNNSLEDVKAVNIHQDFYPNIDTLPGIRHIQVYAYKPGIIKTDTDVEGIVLKGISTDFDWTFMQESLVKGQIFTLSDTSKSNNTIISQTTANRLQLNVGDNLIVYFVQKPPLVRKFTITGIYNTGMAEYDEKYALIDIKHIQKLNKWDKDEVGGFELFLENIDELDMYSDYIYYNIAGQDLQSQNIKEIDPNIFEWLALQDNNVLVILGLMTIVAIINMITALLILILERTNMIGILKALGANNWTIRKIFLYNAALIIGWGIFWGNFIGLGLCLIQRFTGIITIPEESYYISTVPVDINVGLILTINLITLSICLVCMILPTYLVSTIHPIEAIRFK